MPLSDSVRVDTADDDEPISVNEYMVTKALRAIKNSRAGGPDDLPNWVLTGSDRRHLKLLFSRMQSPYCSETC